MFLPKNKTTFVLHTIVDILVIALSYIFSTILIEATPFHSTLATGYLSAFLLSVISHTVLMFFLGGYLPIWRKAGIGDYVKLGLICTLNALIVILVAFFIHSYIFKIRVLILSNILYVFLTISSRVSGNCRKIRHGGSAGTSSRQIQTACIPCSIGESTSSWSESPTNSSSSGV